MAALESCPKHYMITYLDKTDGNAEFHEIMDFLTRIYIYYALTVSPVVSTTFIEQFWMSAKSKTIKNVRYITPTVAGKSVNISEASIKVEIFFDDADGIEYWVKLERPSEIPPIPHPLSYLSEDQPESVSSGGKTLEVTLQAKEIKDLKAQIKKLKKKARPLISQDHKA
ncbi:hypothetical protein Tco_1144071 [Tanacetum coccineum]